MTPVKSPHPQEKNIKKVKITEMNRNLSLWTPTEEQKEKSKMMEFMRHINKQYNLSTYITQHLPNFHNILILTFTQYYHVFFRIEKLLGPL